LSTGGENRGLPAKKTTFAYRDGSFHGKNRFFAEWQKLANPDPTCIADELNQISPVFG